MDRMTKREYSVLMSVYYKDHPEYVRAAIESMLQQTEPPAELVLVCDGQLGEALNRVIEDYARKIVLLRLKKNQGLGMALKEGIKICRCELVARMDSDDISAKSSCALQLDYLEEHPEVDVLSGTLAEFEGAACTEAEVVNTNAVKSLKRLPEHDAELKRYMCRRNPLNHPCVMFRKSKVEAAGGYRSYHLFEDYDLWLRMAGHGATFANIQDVLLYMRINHMYARRGGFAYARAIMAFQREMYRNKWITLPQFFCFTILRVGVSLMPDKLRQVIYKVRLREH